MRGGERHRNIALFVPHLGCPNQCSFCDQRSISGSVSPTTPQEVTAACRQAVRQLGDQAGRAELAFFGGSFTAIARGYMLRLLEAARPFLQDGSIGGIRISTRPDAIDLEVLSILRSYGVSTIELGAQSMDDRVLLQNRRGHSAQAVREASRLIRAGGFRLGLQMMVGLWGDTPAGAWRTARELAALEPNEVRIYPTVVLQGTLLAQRMAQGEFSPMSLEEGIPLCAELLRFFEGRGIPVIRLGLHASRELEEQMVGGCYHPALRELCESHLILTELLKQERPLPPGPLELRVHPRSRSKAVGQRRANLCALQDLGRKIVVVEDDTLPEDGVLLTPMAEH